MILHRIILQFARWAIWSFYKEIHVIGEENVAPDGPIIVVSTHHNMMIDPCVLSSIFPHKRYLHYWTKSSLFKNPILRRVFDSTGNISVERKAADRQALYRGTIHALAAGNVVALFPEGTSYTEHMIMQVKDGASWSALEYIKWTKTHDTDTKPLLVIPVGIVYTNKSKYRSRVIVEFGKPIRMESLEEQFLSAEREESKKTVVKQLTAEIEGELVKLTINSPDWESLFAARMARDLLWDDERTISLDDYVAVSQTLVDLFSTSMLTASFGGLKRALITYYSLLHATKLTNTTLSSLPLPKTLNPSQPTPFPSRLSTLFILLRDSLASLIRLPFFLIPLMVHLPAYAISRVGARLVKDEEETQAQNKIVFAFLLLAAIYPCMFFFLWALFGLTPPGAVVALAMSYAFVLYHVKIVDANYERAKRLVAAWRVLLGVWGPKRWDLSLAALTPYTTPYTPPVNAWIERRKVTGSTPQASPASTMTSNPPRCKRRPSASRKLIRHVLRTRLDAARLLADFFTELERSGQEVRASSQLAKLYGRTREGSDLQKTAEGVQIDPEPQGWRDAKEVIRFLRDKGAKINALRQKVEGDWAAASSDGEGEGGEAQGEGDTEDDVVWVPPGHSP